MGVVTTTRVQHASPAGAYAHTVNRNWYSDADLSADAQTYGCQDIATQLVYNMDIDVRHEGLRAGLGRDGGTHVPVPGNPQSGVLQSLCAFARMGGGNHVGGTGGDRPFHRPGGELGACKGRAKGQPQTHLP